MYWTQFWQHTRDLFGKAGELFNIGYKYLSPLSGVVGPVILLLADNLSVALDPGYDLFRMSISDLALRSTGWLSRTGFGVFAIFLFLEISRLRSFVPNNNKTRIAMTLSILSVIGFFILAIFTTDPPGKHTLHGTIHDVTTLAIAGLFTLGCLFFGFGFKANPRWRGFYIYTMVVVAIAGVCAIIRVIMPLHWEFFGIYERILLWNGVIWFEAVGIKLLIFSKHGIR